MEGHPMARKPSRKPAATGIVERSERAAVLWALFDALRGSNRMLSIPELVNAAKAKGISVTWDDLHEFSARMYHGEPMVVPPFITRFLAGYLSEKKPRSILDPWAGIGSLLLPLAEATGAQLVIGIGPNVEETRTAQTMAGVLPADWMLEKPLCALDRMDKFDLVVSAPPLSLPALSAAFDSPAGAVQVRDSETHVLILKAALHLSDDGDAIFVLPNGFLFGGAGSVREALPRLGVFMNAVIALPAGSFAPLTSIELNLVFVSRKHTPDLFVGSLRPNQDAALLLKNLKKRRPGPAPELGRLVSVEEFVSWQKLVVTEEMQHLAQRSGLVPVPLGDIVKLVNRGTQAEDGGFENLPDCVYLPLIGTSPAVSSLSDLRIKPHNYAQLVVRSDKIAPEFLAGFFNSPLGRKTRDAMLSGTFIPKISKATIATATVYTLAPEAQKKVTDTSREIHDLKLRLEQLERDLWHRPVDVLTVRRALGSLNQKGSFEAWLETLPFPLSSILWRYQAASSPEHKVDHLLNFFEAAAQFLGTLMASAFHSNTHFFSAHKADWFEAGKDNPHSLSRSSFGDWVVRCQRLAKTTRQLLSDADQRDLCLGLYRTTDGLKLDSIANKAVYAVLETVSRYRNDWKGHTGIVGTKEHNRRLSLLQDELTRLRGLLGGLFEEWWFIRPGKSDYAAGVYHYAVEHLMGSRQIFKQVELDTTEVMDSRELYLLDTTTRRPMQLLHFVRMMPLPDTEEVACYFYNRSTKEGVRWVSYHCEGKPERIEPDPAVLRVIEEVEQDGT